MTGTTEEVTIEINGENTAAQLYFGSTVRYQKDFYSRMELEGMVTALALSREITIPNFFNLLKKLEESKAPFNDAEPKRKSNIEVHFVDMSSPNISEVIEKIREGQNAEYQADVPWFPSASATADSGGNPYFEICSKHKNPQIHGHIFWEGKSSCGVASDFEGLQVLYKMVKAGMCTPDQAQLVADQIKDTKEIPLFLGTPRSFIN